MSDERDPERDQQAPIPNDRTPCQDLVVADILERKEFGVRKYGTPLQPFNGRSFLQDSYEEVLDLAVYLRGKLEEEREERQGLEALRRILDDYDHSMPAHVADMLWDLIPEQS